MRRIRDLVKLVVDAASGDTAGVPPDLQAQVDEIRTKLPVPVLWLLGKTQSGKSSIIRAMTGATTAEIGNGFRPCTRTAREYPFPDNERPILRFLDTRGLGEANYDPAEDVQLFVQSSHLLVVVMRCMDHAQQPVLTSLREIRKLQPKWPVLLVQTALHDGYPELTTRHINPYPYASTNPAVLNTIPAELLRSLRGQRAAVEAVCGPVTAVAVDFTLPEDGYEPVEYGLTELWEAIELLLPTGLRNLMMANSAEIDSLRDAHFRMAHNRVLGYASAAAAAAAIPIPMIDVPAILLIQGRMLHDIAAVYHQKLSRERWLELVGTLGLGYLGRLGGRELFKLIPGFGSVATGAYSAATTYALGVAMCIWFSRVREGDIPRVEEFRELYAEQFKTARERVRQFIQQSGRKPVNS